MIKMWLLYRYWWWQLATRWDEFEQHEESMEVYNQSRQQINPPNVSVQPPGQGPPFAMMRNRWPPPQQVMPTPNIMPPSQMGFPPEQNVPQFEAWYPADSQQHHQQQQQQQQQISSQHQSSLMPVVSEAPVMSGGSAQMRYRGNPQQQQQQMGQAMPVYGANSPYTPVLPRGSELTRKPIHGSPTGQAQAKMYGGGGLSKAEAKVDIKSQN